MLAARSFVKETDYPTLCEWWKHWGHSIAPADELTDTGFMIYWEDKPLFCGFLILTNAKFAYVDTVCANPETSWEDREDALSMLLDVCSKVAKDFGFRRLVAIPEKERLSEKVVNAGFKLHSKNVHLLTKEL